MFTRVCCCDIKIAVLVLNILSMISNGFNGLLLGLAIAYIKGTDEQDLFSNLMIVLCVSLSLEILGFLASCLSFASSCADYGEASKRKGFVIPWVIWCFIAMAFNIGFLLYIYATPHGEVDMVKLVYRVYANTVWLVFCAIVGISYIKNMTEGYRPRERPQVMMKGVSDFQGNLPPYYKLQA